MIILWGKRRLPSRRPYRPSTAQHSTIRGDCAWIETGRLFFHQTSRSLPLHLPRVRLRAMGRLDSPKRATIIAIEKMEIGMAPADFEFGRTGQGGLGQWAVVDDPTAKRRRAIEQVSTEPTDNRFSARDLWGRCPPRLSRSSCASNNVAITTGRPSEFIAMAKRSRRFRLVDQGGVSS